MIVTLMRQKIARYEVEMKGAGGGSLERSNPCRKVWARVGLFEKLA